MSCQPPILVRSREHASHAQAKRVRPDTRRKLGVAAVEPSISPEGWHTSTLADVGAGPTPTTHNGSLTWFGSMALFFAHARRVVNDLS